VKIKFYELKNIKKYIANKKSKIEEEINILKTYNIPENELK